VIAGLVVSELSEVLMSYHGKWAAEVSSGEGLSRVATYILHPSIIPSFYDPAPIDIQFWMSEFPNNMGWQAPGLKNNPTSLPSHTSLRQDWVSQTFEGENGVHGDLDWFSFGCAILFIYYLKDQLGFSMAQIIQSGGYSLEERYQSLTGNNGGYAPFRALLDNFYPPGASLPTTLYDLFPLGQGHCRVSAVAALIQDAPPSIARTGLAEAGTMCGPGQYSYTLENLSNHVRITADIAGFAHPLLSWSINGTPVPTTGGAFMVSAVVVSVDPIASASAKTENLYVVVTIGPPPSYPGMTTFIDVTTPGNPGQIFLRFDVTVKDQFATGPDVIATSYAMVTFETQRLVWDPEYWRKVADCWNRYTTTHNRPLPWLRLYMPDPSPELIAAIKILEQLAKETQAIAVDDLRLATQINKRFGGHLLSGHSVE
jgi:hypothetical protein